MKTRNLGPNGPAVSAIGLGCMSMSPVYGQKEDRGEAIATLHRAIEFGITLVDTADSYGPHHNEELLGEALTGRRDRVFLATKFGVVRGSGEPTINGSPAYARSAVEARPRLRTKPSAKNSRNARPDDATVNDQSFGARLSCVSRVRFKGGDSTVAKRTRLNCSSGFGLRSTFMRIMAPCQEERRKVATSSASRSLRISPPSCPALTHSANDRVREPQT
jgi:hypothetical protein